MWLARLPFCSLNVEIRRLHHNYSPRSKPGRNVTRGSMSVITIFHQLTWQQRVLGLSYPYDKGKFDILISSGNFPASSRGEVDPSHKKLFVRCPAWAARAVCL